MNNREQKRLKENDAGKEEGDFLSWLIYVRLC